MLKVVLVAIAALFALTFVPALAETPPATVATTTKTPTPTPPAVTDANALRDDLLTIGMANLNAISASGFLGFFPQWATKYPGLQGNGYAVASVPGNVSIWWNRLEPKGPQNETNPEAIAFAVADSQGHCAAGVLYGSPKIDKSAKLTIASGPCTAQAVVDQFKQVLAATPPPITTVPATITAAPKPPATGNSHSSDSKTSAPWIATIALSLGIAAAITAGANSRRRAKN